MEKRLFWCGRSGKRVKRRKSTWATLAGDRHGGAGCDVGHSEGEAAEVGHPHRAKLSYLPSRLRSTTPCPAVRPTDLGIVPPDVTSPLPLLFRPIPLLNPVGNKHNLLHILNTPAPSVTSLSPTSPVKIYPAAVLVSRA